MPTIVSWRRATAQAVAALIAARRDSTGPSSALPNAEAILPARLDELPVPVARYLAFALPEGQPRIRTARIRWAGEFQRTPGGGWSSFTADQYYTTSPPGFVWDAAIRTLPLVPMRVRDSYVDGVGAMIGRLAGLSIIDQRGTSALASGALMRWLGEAVWFPTALVSSAAVSWEPVDDTIARVIVEDAGNRVEAEFHFAANGEITRMTALRYRDVGGTGVLTEFEGRYSEYVRREGVMIPASAEVAWLLPEGRFPYWRGRPAHVQYETGARPGR
jgi:hypothetical protein